MVRFHPNFLKIDTEDKATGTCEGEEKLFMGRGIILRDNKTSKTTFTTNSRKVRHY